MESGEEGRIDREGEKREEERRKGKGESGEECGTALCFGLPSHDPSLDSALSLD